MKEINTFLNDFIKILKIIDKKKIDEILNVLYNTKKRGGRLFIAGSGGGAGNASHAVCDFRKICNIESYSISENISELTARVNDHGWEKSYSGWLSNSNITKKDILMIFSVGGGNLKKKISINLINAIKFFKSKKGKIVSIVGRKKSYCNRYSDVCLVIPPPHITSKKNITYYTESMQVLIWHLLVSQSKIRDNEPVW